MPTPADPFFRLIPPDRIANELEQERSDRNFRPTVMAVAYTAACELLVVQSPNEKEDIFWLLQGGLHDDELDDPKIGVRRELHEEVSGLSIPTIGECLGGFRSRTTTPRDGYSDGKLYVAYPVLFAATASGVQPVEGETAAAKLVTTDQLAAQLERNSNPGTFPDSVDQDRRRRKALFTHIFVKQALASLAQG